MKNLIKNVIRSFKNNKISLIGLIFLLFFGLGTFCTMANTTANIGTQYNAIAKKGNLHDITASELYEIGNAAYLCNNKGFTYNHPSALVYNYERRADINELSTKLCASSESPTMGEDTYYYVVPTQTSKVDGDYTIYTRTYNLVLSSQHSTGLYKKFAESSAPEKNLEIKVVEKVTTGSEPAYITAVAALNETPVEDWTNAQMDALMAGGTYWSESGNALCRDYNYFLKAIDERTSYIYNLMTTKDTLLSKYIDENYSKEMNYRFFKSINVTASKDNIFYKVINSNPTDTIDKLVLFKDPQGNYGNQLFNVADWAPFGSELKFTDTAGKTVPAGTKFDDLVVPSTFEELILIEPVAFDQMGTWSPDKKFVYSQIMHIRFKRMFSGDRTTDNPTLEPMLESLAAIRLSKEEYNTQLFNSGSTINTNYASYVDYRQPSYWNENIIISANGNIVINWMMPTPLSCTMVNWTSHFSVINPQHLSATGKHVISPTDFTNFKPFRVWYINEYGEEPSTKELSQSRVMAWLNTLTNKQFNFWWRPQTFTSGNSMKYVIYKKDGSKEEITVIKGQKVGQWWGVSDSAIASCGEYYQIIWGCGLSPDFMYPVVDVTRPTPNVKTECLTYCNDAGYKALRLAFFNSPTEDFLVAKFMPSVTTTRQNQIINDLNSFCAANMLFPKDIKAVYRANDTRNVLNSSAFRVAYIPNLVSVIRLVTIILSIFLAILSLVICLIIIKRYVENNRINIGIMRANGISKIKIALSLLPFALFPAIIGGIAAYLVGLFLQIPMLKLFGNYWTLPTPILNFEWISMVTCIVLPFILFGVITIVAALWVLRTKSVELMKAGSEFKTNSFSKVAKKPFKHFGILTRFRVALAFNSLSRLVMLGLMSCLTMTSLVFAMTSFGKLNQSQVINSSQFDYKFNLQLTTPTTAGGNYGVEDWSKTGLGYSDPDNYIYNVSWAPGTDREEETNLTKWYSDLIIGGILTQGYRDAIGKNGNLMLPTMADATGQKQDLQYLMNKTCSKLTLDYVVGLGSLSSNPWEIAIALMPANSRNMASNGYNTIVNKIGTAIDDPTHPDHTKWNEFRDFFTQDQTSTEEEKPLIQPFELDVSTKSWLSRFSNEYVKFLVTIYNTPELIADEYRISYGIVPTNWTYGVTTTKKDETYSYLTGPITSISTKQRSTFDKTHEITIEGIAPSSDFIKLTDSRKRDLNEVLYAASEKEDEVRPIIVNAFAAHKYNLGIGSTFTITATNTADRYDRQMHPEYDKSDKSNVCKFRVVGISQGTNGEAFYCTQLDANNVLGLPNGRTWNKTHKYMMWQESLASEKRVIDLSCINASSQSKYAVYHVDNDGSVKKETTEVDKFKKVSVPVGFNGIYTADPKGRPLTSGLSLYSYSGLYPGASVYDSVAMQNLLAYDNNLPLANFMTGINDPDIYNVYSRRAEIGEEAYMTEGVNKFIGLLRKYYGDTTMVTCICGANDVAASDLIYKNLISTFNLAETSIMSVIIPITIVVVGIISNLIINDSKKMAAMLKALGYSDKKNAMSILALFVPTIIIGLALAIPLTIGVATGYQALIFTNANILIDVSRKWWYYLAGVGGIGIILVATYVVGWASLKKDRLVDQIKK